MAKAVLEALQQKFPEAVRDLYTHRGDDVAFVEARGLVEVCNFLKFDPSTDLKLMLSVTGVDYLGESPRFECVYHFTSMTHHHRVRLRVKAPDDADPRVPSVAGIWRTANWWERHVFDLYGIRFDGHPDLRRLYMPESFVGHPLRKDYPMKGRQPLIPERDFRDVIRGPGPQPREQGRTFPGRSPILPPASPAKP